MKKIILIIISMMLCTTLLSIDSRAKSCLDVSWKYAISFDVNQTYIDSDLLNFPVLVSINDSIGDLCKPNGTDIRFVANSNTSICPYDIEKWVDGYNRLIWVRLPRIDDSINTRFWMLYGSDGATKLYNSTSVWSNYNYVLHMNGTTTIQDSTINNHDGIASSDSNSSGIVNYCQYFTRANADSVNMGDNNDFSYGDGTNDIPFTLSCWVKPSYTVTGSGQYFILYGKDAINNREYQVFYYVVTGTYYISILIIDSSTSPLKYQSITTSNYLIPQTCFSLLTFTYSGSKLANGLNVYVNGTKLSRTCTNRSGYVAMENKANVSYIGDYGYSNTETYYGSIDESRCMRNTEENLSYIKAEYNSVYNQNTFIIVGNQIVMDYEYNKITYFDVFTVVPSLFPLSMKLNWTKNIGADKVVIFVDSFPFTSGYCSRFGGYISIAYNGTGNYCFYNDSDYNHAGNSYGFVIYAWNETNRVFNDEYKFAHDTFTQFPLYFNKYSINSTVSYTEENYNPLGLGLFHVINITSIGNATVPLSIALFENYIDCSGTLISKLNSTSYSVYANATGFNESSLNETGSPWLYLGAMLSIDDSQFYLMILISVWLFFIFIYEEKEKTIYALCIIFLGIPLGLIMSGIAYYNSYPFGYLISFIVILISFLLPIYNQYKGKKK